MADTVDNIDREYVIIDKTMNNIIEELNLDEDDKILCESIIKNLEKDAANNIRNMKVVQIPNIGCIRINPIKRKLRDGYKSFRLARQHMTREQYKDYMKSYVNDLKEEQNKKDRFKLIIKKIRSNNRVKYDTYCTKINRSYAEMFIAAIYYLKEVPFDAEFEEQYQSLKD